MARVGMVAMGTIAACLPDVPEAQQPLAISHATHEAEDMACEDCHQGVEKTPAAGFPGIAGCMLCHDEPKGEHPDEPKIREYAEAGEEIPWVKINANVGHVFFSHAAHVTLAEMECKECHGEMKKRKTPVTRPTPKLHNMDSCVACHEQREASIDCLRCHK